MQRVLSIISMVAIAVGLLTACQGNVFELEVGQCFNDPDAFDEISDVEIVDCGTPHDNEVYHLFDLPDGDFPGDETVSDRAAQGCIDAFEPYVGTDFWDSTLDASSLNPTADSWDGGDREIVCFLFDVNLAELTGSSRSSGI